MGDHTGDHVWSVCVPVRARHPDLSLPAVTIRNTQAECCHHAELLGLHIAVYSMFVRLPGPLVGCGHP